MLLKDSLWSWAYQYMPTISRIWEVEAGGNAEFEVSQHSEPWATGDPVSKTKTNQPPTKPRNTNPLAPQTHWNWV